MKHYNNIFIAASVFLFLSCDNRNYDIESYYTKEQSDSLMFSILPYIAKLEKKVNYENRFNPEHKAYFMAKWADYKFQFKRYFITEDSTHYFLIWKVAPSLYEKYIAIGGRFKKDKNGKVIQFEEIFNTWKMKPDELEEKSFALFDYMVKNGNVDPFMKEEYLIEFPDDKVYYDKKECRWKVKNPTIVDSLLIK
ncbi:MAG: hypothetical protein NZ529_10640 [Cytophagaceae bacterium]|nr:hypothetical protein [Cytophagaceae bacterium]MDW8457244.1 hypothetical protein [Cytophagaceae bacterium]